MLHLVAQRYIDPIYAEPQEYQSQGLPSAEILPTTSFGTAASAKLCDCTGSPAKASFLLHKTLFNPQALALTNFIPTNCNQYFIKTNASLRRQRELLAIM
jgi:hypothetical protein